MLTIKYIWLCVIILVTAAGSYGAGYMTPDTDEDLAEQLKRAQDQIGRLYMNCDKPTKKFERGEIVKPTVPRGF